jgi:hypothetical protein
MSVDPTTFVTEMLGLSVAAERVTETIKQFLSGLFGEIKNAQAQSAVTQIVAIVSSMFVVGLSHADPLGVSKGCITGWLQCKQGWECILFTGILASGGSAFWNHLLDILKAAKVNSEQSANAKLAAKNQPAIVG